MRKKRKKAFVGKENSIKLTVDRDTESFWKQFTRLDYVPDISLKLYFLKDISLNMSIRIVQTHADIQLGIFGLLYSCVLWKP